MDETCQTTIENVIHVGLFYPTCTLEGTGGLEAAVVTARALLLMGGGAVVGRLTDAGVTFQIEPDGPHLLRHSPPSTQPRLFCAKIV